MNMIKIMQNLKDIKLLLTDCDGVLTDNGVYYGADGEELKRFSFRDGMGVERLMHLCNVETGILTKENSPALARRAQKLKIKELHMGVLSKKERLMEIMKRKELQISEIAYIGDDVNDLEVLQMSGFSAAPSDAMEEIAGSVQYQCKNAGGHGAFREVAELIIKSKM